MSEEIVTKDDAPLEGENVVVYVVVDGQKIACNTAEEAAEWLMQPFAPEQ